MSWIPKTGCWFRLAGPPSPRPRDRPLSIKICFVGDLDFGLALCWYEFGPLRLETCEKWFIRD